MGKWLIIIGILLILAGILLHFGFRLPWLGKLPGDFHFKAGNTNIYFPLATCLLISLLLSVILYVIRMLRP